MGSRSKTEWSRVVGTRTVWSMAVVGFDRYSAVLSSGLRFGSEMGVGG